MDKPLTVEREEFINKICGAINEANLPAFAIADVLRNCLGDVEQLMRHEYINQKREWEKSQGITKSRPVSNEEKTTIVNILNEVVDSKVR